MDKNTETNNKEVIMLTKERAENKDNPEELNQPTKDKMLEDKDNITNKRPDKLKSKPAKLNSNIPNKT
jgi:hypothetical protein